MKTISTLVAASTVGVGGVGLALGQAENNDSHLPNLPIQTARDDEYPVANAPIVRPATSAAVSTPRRRHFRTSSLSPAPFAAFSQASPTTNDLKSLEAQTFSPRAEHTNGRKNSISSSSSWMKRLSSIGSSKSSSPRSSVATETASPTFSYASEAPIVSPKTSPSQLPPNKLVKRTASGRRPSGSPLSRGATVRVRTLRRPATSHQRASTLAEQFRIDGVKFGKAHPPRQSITTMQFDSAVCDPVAPFTTTWRWYLRDQVKCVKLLNGKGSKVEDGIYRVVIAGPKGLATLIKPGTISISGSAAPEVIYEEEDGMDSYDDFVPELVLAVHSSPGHEACESAATRRSPSLSLRSGNTSWLAKAGSIRLQRRRGSKQPVEGNTRSVSAPISEVVSTNPSLRPTTRNVTSPAAYGRSENSPEPSKDESVSRPAPADCVARVVSPVPSLSRKSSFQLDLTRLALSSSSNTLPIVAAPPTGLRPSPALVSTEQQSRPQCSEDNPPSDRTSTLVGSDNDNKEFPSGEDDDDDYQSEAIYDSYRTHATGNTRSPTTPLQSVFDDSPPFEHTKKTSGFYELAPNGQFSLSRHRIIEEEEGTLTPNNHQQLTNDNTLSTPVRPNDRSGASGAQSSPPSFRLASNKFDPTSLDDDEEDEDWTKDEEPPIVGSPLSSPFSSRQVNQSTHQALLEITNNRQHGKLLEYSEQITPLGFSKSSGAEYSARPRTVHTNQAGTARDSRSCGRRPLTHFRSQSLPPGQDGDGNHCLPALPPKFGTWGQDNKKPTEDWDDDLDFDLSGIQDEGQNQSLKMPEKIRDVQASVRDNVGHVRDVLILVTDLKRLRKQGQDRSLLYGEHAELWEEALGIIDLANPVVANEKNSHLDTHDLATPTEGKPVDNDGEVRRKSVLISEDDIFGTPPPPPKSNDHLLTPLPAHSSSKESSEVARTVMEVIDKNRSTSDPAKVNPSDKILFDTTTLKDLVNRASVLSRTLATHIRNHDNLHLTPTNSPQRIRETDPPFTRVFTDPSQTTPATPTKRGSVLRSNSTILGAALGSSVNSSPPKSLSPRMQMMTVI